MANKTYKKIKSLLTIVGLAITSPLLPSTTYAEQPVEPNNNLFVGSVVDQKHTQEDRTEISIDSLLTYDHKNESALRIESVNLPEEKSHDLSLGGRTPKFAGDLLRVSGVADVSLDNNEQSYTAFLEAFPLTDIVLRGGLIHGASAEHEDALTTGGFLSGKYKHSFFTVEGDAWHNGEQAGGQGFLAGVIPLEEGVIYLSLGGNYRGEDLNGVLGIIKDDFGLFARTRVDLAQKKQAGKFILTPAGTKLSRRYFDFQSHYSNRTEMHGVATGAILDGWAPFDASKTDGDNGHVVVSGEWSNSEAQVGAEAIAEDINF